MAPMHAAFRRIDTRANDVAASVLPESPRSGHDESPAVTLPINQARWRNRIRATGTVRALQVQVTETGSSLGCEIGDEAGSLLLIFPGRRRIPGIDLGARVLVEGMVGLWRRQLAILNPYYELVSD
ncbi:MAG: OB-fold nucleic acid binding domain-containing protein [Candidatus Dormibacteria bacterium]